MPGYVKEYSKAIEAIQAFGEGPWADEAFRDYLLLARQSITAGSFTEELKFAYDRTVAEIKENWEQRDINDSIGRYLDRAFTEGLKFAYEVPSQNNHSDLGLAQKLATLDWAMESHLLAEKLTAYAGFGERQGRTAETILARKLAEGIERQSRTVDLTQRYATDDPELAQARHDIAIDQLADFIAKAEYLGFAICRGEGIAVAINQAERLSL